jgi:hypothetical protein
MTFSEPGFVRPVLPGYCTPNFTLLSASFGRLLEESAMSEETLAIFITVLVIVLMFVWVPVLEFICPPCGRVLERLRSKKRHEARQGGTAEIKSRARIM